ncbi:MAG: leucine-rich repeat domain-containing protein [Bacteroidales bacterium]|nr:leucine-rich repeat domain-containing protein [Bacteroidales bacterium]
MRKAIFLLVLIASGMAAAAQSIQYDTVSNRKVGQLYFRITSRNTAELTYMLCPNGVCDWYPDTVVVPPSVTIDGREYTVNRIGDGAVNRGSRVRSFTMPETITEIGNQAFQGLFINITLPESVRTIGAEAFPVNSRPANIRIPRNVEHIDEAAFYGSNIIRFTVDSANRHFVAVDSVALCNADTTLLIAFVNSDTLPHYTLPATIRRIGKGAFFTCQSLRTLTLPDGLREMGDCILFGTPLRSLHIPATVCRIEGAPRNVPSANFDLTVDPASTHYRMADNQLMSYDGDTLIQVLGATGDYTVPNSVRVLAPGLFYRNTTLGTVHLPDGLTTIGEKAFYYSSANVVAPTSIQSIGEMAFYMNSGTTRLNLPNLTHIGASAFEYSAIHTLDSTLQLTTIPRRAFYQSKLAKFSFGDQLESLGEGAFFYTNLYPGGKITLPASLKRLGADALNTRTRLKEITFINPVDTIGSHAFHCRFLRFYDTVVPVCYGTPLIHVDSVYVPCGHLDAFVQGIPHDSTTGFAEWCPPVGITNPAALQVSLYPNPTDGPVSITLAEPAPAGSRLTLLDATGRQVLKQNLLPGSQQLTLTLQQLPSGIYFLTLTTPDASTTRKLLLTPTRRQ